ncbi:MAG: MBL fold metallo-hydrolase, partial [Deltaproteobacteria bacterium]
AHPVAQAARGFPRPIDDGLYHCGYHAEASFGAASWLLVRERGNVLVDSPRYSEPLARNIEVLGGVRYLFLTHRDDVADHRRWARRFACERVLHRDDLTSETKDVEHLLRGDAPVALEPDLLAIPVPGHTRGSMCLLEGERVLFTGDHLAWSLRERRLVAFRRACWYDWQAQIQSMERLLRYRFSWVLPGHGAPVFLPPAEMHAQLESLVQWMRAPH